MAGAITRWAAAALALTVFGAAGSARAQTGAAHVEKLDDAKRQAWLKRGGWLTSYEARANVIGLLLPEQSLPDYCPATGYREREKRPWGAGAGVGGRVSMMHLSLPKPDAASTFFAFRAGGGLDASGMYLKNYGVEVFGFCPKIVDASVFAYSIQAPLVVGGHVGLGGFDGAASWSGIVLGAAWAPSFSYVDASDIDAVSDFNYLGFELTADFATLSATLESYAQEPHFRIFGFVLPPVGSDSPWIAIAGVGIVWY
jgi:hypothetical protein